MKVWVATYEEVKADAEGTNENTGYLDYLADQAEEAQWVSQANGEV